MLNSKTDALILQAWRKRMLKDIAQRQGGQAGAQKLINNVYGGHGGSSSAPAGVMGQMAGSPAEPDDKDYFVDITRRDLEDKDPTTGKSVGWNKKVHRFTKKKVVEMAPTGET